MIQAYPLNVHMVVSRAAELIDAEVDGEIVALNIGKGQCYGLNKVGSRIWQLLEQPVRIADMCATLIREYEIDKAVCERDVLDLLEDLRAEDMIIVSEEAQTALP